jgi:hypothetical protein
MKKTFVIFLALCGIIMVINGVLNFFSLDFSVISENSVAYSLGHNVGVIFRKSAKIIIGVFLIKYCYDWFRDENHVQKTN